VWGMEILVRGGDCKMQACTRHEFAGRGRAWATAKAKAKAKGAQHVNW
jgi:hypothetical protein